NRRGGAHRLDYKPVSGFGLVHRRAGPRGGDQADLRRARTSPLRSLASYLQIVSMGVQMIAAYRVEAVVETLSMLLQVYLLRAIWEAVYAGQEQLDGRPVSLVIAYVTIATIQNWLLSPNLAYFLAERVRDGRVGIELVRPVPFL